MPNSIRGILFALIAAALNASIGIFSKVLLKNGLNIQDIAFLKTITAFFLLSIFMYKKTFYTQRKEILVSEKNIPIWQLLLQIALCAFLGIFVLFFFETTAYQYGFASNVVVILMASAALSALVFGKILLNDKINASALIGTMFAIIGIFVISWSKGAHYLLVFNAILAGSGYGIFSVLLQKFNLKGGLALTRMLMLFGSIYLLFPFLYHFHNIKWNIIIGINILALALLPTIFGFYCTTKALSYLSASKVQVTELSEPIFAALLAWLFVSEIPSNHFFVGALFIILGIALINQMINFTLLKKA